MIINNCASPKFSRKLRQWYIAHDHVLCGGGNGQSVAGPMYISSRYLEALAR
jgi:hypothetical protein